MRILLLEDEVPWAEMVTATITEAGGAIDWACTTGEFFNYVRSAAGYDVIMLDRIIAGETSDGLMVLQALRKEYPRIPVMILSHLSGPHSTAEGLDVGADDYVAKPFDRVELTARLRALMRRCGVEAEPNRIARGPLELWPHSRVAYFAAQRLDLSQQAFDVLRILLENCNGEVSRQALWAEVWPHWVRIPPKNDVIEAAVYRLRQELRRVGASNLVRTIKGIGYTLETV